MITEKQIKEELIRMGEVPEMCENNEYWAYWYKTIFKVYKNIVM